MTHMAKTSQVIEYEEARYRLVAEGFVPVCFDTHMEAVSYVRDRRFRGSRVILSPYVHEWEAWVR